MTRVVFFFFAKRKLGKLGNEISIKKGSHLRTPGLRSGALKCVNGEASSGLGTRTAWFQARRHGNRGHLNHSTSWGENWPNQTRRWKQKTNVRYSFVALLASSFFPPFISNASGPCGDRRRWSICSGASAFLETTRTMAGSNRNENEIAIKYHATNKIEYLEAMIE